MAANNNQNNPTIAGALTFPRRDEVDIQPVPVQPRQPRSLQGLLRFAMEATKVEDAPGHSEIGPMDEERRKFLEEALKSITIDVAEVLQNAIKVLTDAEKIKSIQLGDTLPNDVQTSFKNLLEFIDDIDIANDFYKMGGFSIFPICFGSENDEVRAYASSVLAELCQNNPFCQARTLECGLLNILLNLAQSERGNALVKCLYALSCATREFEPSCRELISQNGCETLAQQLRATELSARTKAAFLIRYFSQNYNEAKEQFIKQNLAKIITDQIKAGHDESTEHILGVLMTLVEDEDPTVLAQCRDPNVNLKNILEEHLRILETEGDRYQEEKEYCQGILKKVFEDCPDVEPQNDEVTR